MLRTCSGAPSPLVGEVKCARGASVAATARRANQNTPPVLPDEASPLRKNISVSENQKLWSKPPRPVLSGGRVAIVTNVERGMRWTRSCRKTCGAVAYGQAVWSCPLDAGVKLIEMNDERRWLSSPTHRGEHGASRKAIAQGVPDRFGQPVVTMLVCFLFYCTQGCGCGQRPAFPAPSVLDGRCSSKPRTQFAPRECGRLFEN